MVFFLRKAITTITIKRLVISCHFLLLISTSLVTSYAFAIDKTPVNQAQQPKLVLLLVVDGLPQEQVVRYRDQFSEGGFKRLLTQGAWYSNAHQAHAVTKTAVGHSAISTGAYPYQHGIISNDWFDNKTLEFVYCTEDKAHTYIGEETAKNDGTSPANLKVTTIGDELRYATGNQSKVIAISGKDRGAILLAGQTGTAYMLMKKSGAFASSTYYMKAHPHWLEQYQKDRPQDRYYGQSWSPLLPEKSYALDASDDIVAPLSKDKNTRFPFVFDSKSGKPDAEYYGKLFTGPFVDELTLDFAKAAIGGEQLGNNANGATDLLAISLSGHDYVNHEWGPESRMSHDHLQRLDRMLADFFKHIDQKIGLNNTLIVLTADHGFANTAEFSKARNIDAQRIDSRAMMLALNQHLSSQFDVTNVAKKWYSPTIVLDSAQIQAKGLSFEKIEAEAANFLSSYNGVSHVFTRTQLESDAIPNSRMSLLMQRAWNKNISGDIMLVLKPHWYFGSKNVGAQHGSPYTYDSNVPLMMMGKPWIKAGAYGQYAEVVDIASTLAHLLRIRPPAAAEGKVLVEALK